MAARSIGTATISFGLVSVPVNLYSSSESTASVWFNMLHKKCSARLKQQYICPKDNDESSRRTRSVKGYEFAKDQYVLFTPEELKALEEKATNTIDIIEFVPLCRGGPDYLEKVLSRPRQGRRPRLPPPGRRAQGDRKRRARPVLRPRQAAPRPAPAAWTTCS